MSFLCCCFGQGADENAAPARSAVALDVFHIGPEAVIVKAGRRLCGAGAALANAPLVQNKSIWEVTLQAQGIWGIGVAQRQINLGEVPLGKNLGSWMLRFYINGVCMNAGFSNVRGEVYPVIYVDKGGILEVEFSSFIHNVPGFMAIMFEKNIL